MRPNHRRQPDLFEGVRKPPMLQDARRPAMVELIRTLLTEALSSALSSSRTLAVLRLARAAAAAGPQLPPPQLWRRGLSAVVGGAPSLDQCDEHDAGQDYQGRPLPKAGGHSGQQHEKRHLLATPALATTTPIPARGPPLWRGRP